MAYQNQIVVAQALSAVAATEVLKVGTTPATSAAGKYRIFCTLPQTGATNRVLHITVDRRDAGSEQYVANPTLMGSVGDSFSIEMDLALTDSVQVWAETDVHLVIFSIDNSG